MATMNEPARPSTGTPEPVRPERGRPRRAPAGPAAPTYHERLWVPVLWWVFAAFLLATLWLAYASALGAGWANLISGAGVLLVVGTFLGYGAATVQVNAELMRAGRATLPLNAVGAVTSLTDEQAARLRGRDANASAYLLLRPYLRRAVVIEIADEADPTPYWYVASRRPERLAEAIEQARKGQPRHGTDVSS